MWVFFRGSSFINSAKYMSRVRVLDWGTNLGVSLRDQSSLEAKPLRCSSVTSCKKNESLLALANEGSNSDLVLMWLHGFCCSFASSHTHTHTSDVSAEKHNLVFRNTNGRREHLQDIVYYQVWTGPMNSAMPYCSILWENLTKNMHKLTNSQSFWGLSLEFYLSLLHFILCFRN